MPVDVPQPIILAVDLAVTPEATFEAFTQRFGDWWPVATHSLSRQSATYCRLEAEPGGAVDERAPDGSLHVWGEVLAVEPGRRIRFSWHPGREPATAQWIDVSFEAAASGSRVTLTHGGWETLREIGLLLRQEYISGWHYVLGDLFVGYVSASH